MGASPAQVRQESMLRVNHHSFSSPSTKLSFLSFPCVHLCQCAFVVVSKLQLRLWTRKLSPRLDVLEPQRPSSPDIRAETITGHCPGGSHEQRAQGSCRRKQRPRVHVIIIGQCSHFHFLPSLDNALTFTFSDQNQQQNWLKKIV